MGNLLATTYSTTGSGGGGFVVLLILALVFYVLVSLGLYGTFIKAGQPGWAGFVPLYNFIVLLRVAGRPKSWGWFLLLILIPYIGSLALFIVYIFVANDVSKSFGHGTAFTVGLVIPYVSAVFYYILWLGPSQYRGPSAAMGGGYGGGYPPPQGGYPRNNPAIRPPVPRRLPTADPGPTATASSHRFLSPAARRRPTSARTDAPAPIAAATYAGVSRPSPSGPGAALGTLAKVSRMASASARAESGSSSMATRAPAPRDGFNRSMFNVWSAGAWTGWSK